MSVGVKHIPKRIEYDIVKVTEINAEDIKRWIPARTATTARNRGKIVLFEWSIDNRTPNISALIGEYLVKNPYDGSIEVIDKETYERYYESIE